MPLINFKRLNEHAVIPTRGTYGSAGLDLYLCYGLTIQPRWGIKVMFGLAVEIPEGYVGLITSRSSIAAMDITIPTSVIDSDYRGEISCRMWSYGESHTFQAGHRIAQLVVVESPRFEPYEVNELSTTARGTGGYGSTGK